MHPLICKLDYPVKYIAPPFLEYPLINSVPLTSADTLKDISKKVPAINEGAFSFKFLLVI